MKKEFVVTSVSALPEDGTIILSLIDSALLKPRKWRSEAGDYFGVATPNYYNSDYCTRIRFDLGEYTRLGPKVGDRISMEIAKVKTTCLA